ncbi:hypothetical protein [Streptomyces sp. NPDC001914]|uniref:hypothetical protein n=1 Tax=Streptomyces sp. NPDC001914 TaxID=3364623 RepID=UPI0036BE53EC
MTEDEVVEALKTVGSALAPGHQPGGVLSGTVTGTLKLDALLETQPARQID